eukprot:scaffold33319_cov152-Isochrysis_galbana.AAC.1
MYHSSCAFSHFTSSLLPPSLARSFVHRTAYCFTAVAVRTTIRSTAVALDVACSLCAQSTTATDCATNCAHYILARYVHVK